MCTGSLKVFFLAFSGQKNFAKGGCALSRAQNLFTALFVFLRRWGGFDPQKLPAVRFLRRWGGFDPRVFLAAGASTTVQYHLARRMATPQTVDSCHISFIPRATQEKWHFQ